MTLDRVQKRWIDEKLRVQRRIHHTKHTIATLSVVEHQVTLHSYQVRVDRLVFLLLILLDYLTHCLTRLLFGYSPIRSVVLRVDEFGRGGGCFSGRGFRRNRIFPRLIRSRLFQIDLNACQRQKVELDVKRRDSDKLGRSGIAMNGLGYLGLDAEIDVGLGQSALENDGLAMVFVSFIGENEYV